MDSALLLNCEAAPADLFERLWHEWASGWPKRLAILDATRHQVSDSPDPPSHEEACRAAAAAAALLRIMSEGGALDAFAAPPHLVHTQMTSAIPEWTARFGLRGVERLHAILVSAGMVIRARETEAARSAAVEMAQDRPEVLLTALACSLVRTECFDTDAVELSAALLLGGSSLDGEHLAEQAAPALQEYWTRSGHPITRTAVEEAIDAWLYAAQCCGVIPFSGDAIGRVGRASLTAMLRYRLTRSIGR